MRSRISPAELLCRYLEGRLSVGEDDSDVPGMIVVGRLNHEQQQRGGVSIVDAGLIKENPGIGLREVRHQVRVIAASSAEAERIASLVWAECDGEDGDGVHRVLVQSKNGKTYLIQWMNVTGGPSMHYDSTRTFEELMYIKVAYMTQPVEQSA